MDEWTAGVPPVERRLSFRFPGVMIEPNESYPENPFILAILIQTKSETAYMNWISLVDQNKKELRRILLAWFRRTARDLPWRRTRDPYCIWLSEIMLQQTRVEAVIAYYQRFLEAFPTLESLAAAPEDLVLKQWEGLGYYSRARNLQRTAKILVEEYGGNIPRTLEEWRRLPGVGRYTAGAVVSIAFGVPAPVVDGNVKRVFARLFCVKDCVNDTKTIDAFWEAAERLLSRRAPGNFNQSLMELGARICIPKKPRCGECPVQTYCEAYKNNVTESLPIKRLKKTPPHAEVVAAAIRKNGRYLLGKRPHGGMLGGLWEFPGGKVEKGETHKEALRREIMEELGIEVEVTESLASVDHVYSHLTVTIHLYSCRQLGGKPKPLYHSELKWVSRARFGEFAFPAANIKFFPFL